MDYQYVKAMLAGKGFHIGDILSSGSFAVVRSATASDLTLKDKNLAVKIVDRAKAPKDFVVKFFPKELAIMKDLDHENIIKMYAVVTVGWHTCIFMERADQGDLLEIIMKNGVFKAEEARKTFLQILDSMLYLHDREIAHRDLKCENILIDKDYKVKLADFGFSRYVVDKDNKRLLSETYCGSAAYAAPEILKGSPYNPKMSDVWSLGVVLYVMVDAIMPFDDGDYAQLLRDQLNKKWRFNPDYKSGIHPACRSLIKKMLEPDIPVRCNLKQAIAWPWFTEDSSTTKVSKKSKNSFFEIFGKKKNQ